MAFINGLLQPLFFELAAEIQCLDKANNQHVFIFTAHGVTAHLSAVMALMHSARSFNQFKKTTAFRLHTKQSKFGIKMRDFSLSG